MSTNENESPLKRLLDAGNDLIAEGMANCHRDDPQRTAAAIEAERAGAFPRLIVDTMAHGLTTVDLVLCQPDGEILRLFQFRAQRKRETGH